MAIEALANIYRPKTLADLIGQPVVVQTLGNAVKNNKLHHAYILVGQFGSGKTTVARILAAMENCEVSPGVEPCGKCRICKLIFEGKHQDIIEVDAASNAKIDEVRLLKKEMMYNPVDGAKTKYIILDECHRMSDAANDALLKTLEEPPPKTRFVLCTTDVQKVRPAVVSRCQRHDFVKIFWMQIAEHLVQIAKQEKIEVETGAINLCARLAKGSMRSGLQNLQKLIDFAGNGSVTTDHAQKMFGEVSEFAYFDLFDELIGAGDGLTDTTKAFKIINRMLSDGAEYQTIANGLADHLDMLMIGLTAASAGDLIHLGDDGKTRLRTQLKRCREQNRLASVMHAFDHLESSNFGHTYGIPPETVLRKWYIEALFEFRS